MSERQKFWTRLIIVGFVGGAICEVGDKLLGIDFSNFGISYFKKTVHIFLHIFFGVAIGTMMNPRWFRKSQSQEKGEDDSSDGVT